MRAEKDIEGSSYSRHCHTMSVGGIHRCLPTLLDKEMQINYFLKALNWHSYFYFTSLSFSLVVQSTPMLLLAVQDIGISHNLSNSWPYKGRGGEEVLMDRLRDLRVCLNIWTDYRLWIVDRMLSVFLICHKAFASFLRWEKAKRPLLTDRPWLVSNSFAML